MATLERLKQILATPEQIEQARKAEKYGKVEELVATYGLLRGISSLNYNGKEQSRVYVEQALACAQKLCDVEIPDEREKLIRRVCRNCNAAQQCAVDADYPLGADIARALFSLRIPAKPPTDSGINPPGDSGDKSPTDSGVMPPGGRRACWL